MAHASFSMLLTTCSHIVCSSCWNRRGNGECPKCEVKANTLNLSTAKELPKQLEPYYKNPVELIKRLLETCEFQEYQKRQTLERRRVAWVLINHQRAKEDFEKEYAECKQILTALNERKRAVKQLCESLRRQGIDPVQALRGKVSDSVISSTIGVPPSPSVSAPSTPFFPTPLAQPPSTSTPAYTHPPAVEFVEPKKLPHTMRGSVTSKAVRRSPSNPPTPISRPQFTNNIGNVLPVKRPRVTTPVSHQQHVQLMRGQQSGQPMRHTGQPMRQSDQPMQQSGHPVMQSGQLMTLAGRPVIHLGQPARQSMTGHSMIPSQPLMQSGRISSQSGQPTMQSGRPMAQPALQCVQPMMHSGPPRIQSVQPIIPSRRPILQSGQLAMQLGQQQGLRPASQPPQQQAIGRPGSVRVRAVPPSSVPQRIFPSPMSTRPSQSTRTPSQPQRTISPSNRHLGSSRVSAGIQQTPSSGSRISLKPAFTSAPHSRAPVHPVSQIPQRSPRGRACTPTNPSPLLRAFSTTPQSSPWQRGHSSQGSGSPWKQGPTPPPGLRLSAGAHRGSGRGPRLTPMRS